MNSPNKKFSTFQNVYEAIFARTNFITFFLKECLAKFMVNVQKSLKGASVDTNLLHDENLVITIAENKILIS